MSKEADGKYMANAFVDWLISENGGQEVVRTFAKGGVVLYSVAPPKKRLLSKI